MTQKQYDFLFKLLLIGDSGVGKHAFSSDSLMMPLTLHLFQL